MSWRTVVISQTSKLDYQIGYLVVRGHETHKIHLDEIGILIIESTAVSMTAYLLSELIKKKIKVIFAMRKGILHRNYCRIMVLTIQVLKSGSRLNGRKRTRKKYGQRLSVKRLCNRRCSFSFIISRKQKCFSSIYVK